MAPKRGGTSRVAASRNKTPSPSTSEENIESEELEAGEPDVKQGWETPSEVHDSEKDSAEESQEPGGECPYPDCGLPSAYNRAKCFP